MSEVVDILRENDINADDYVRGPLGRNIFAISIRPYEAEGQLKIWPALAKIDVFPDKGKRQAILYIDESKRKIERTYKFYEYRHSVRTRARRQFSDTVVLPTNSTIVISEPKLLVKSAERDDTYGLWEVKATANLPKSRQTLLVGMDETYHFISALKSHVKSVDAAHRILRPEGVMPETLRQGEWFFIPVDERMEARLDDIALNNPHRVLNRVLGNSSHQARQAINRDGVVYVTGFVYDARGSRHHQGLYLPNWHRVVKNEEIEVVRENTPQGRMARTWD